MAGEGAMGRRGNRGEETWVDGIDKVSNIAKLELGVRG
jgi:hypothetical protein